MRENNQYNLFIFSDNPFIYVGSKPLLRTCKEDDDILSKKKKLVFGNSFFVKHACYLFDKNDSLY